MLEVININVRSFSLDFLDVFWEIEDTTENIDNYLFYVYRSGAEKGPFIQISTGLKDTYLFRDGRVNLYSKLRTYYYKIKVKDINTGEIKDFGPSHLQYLPDPQALEIAKRNFILLEQANGTRCYLFKRKRFGARCSCYDSKLGKAIVANCQNCYGVGYLGGYETPIITYIQIYERASELFQSGVGDVEREEAAGRASNYPIIEPRDFIVDDLNRRFRVTTPVERTNLKGAVTSQMFKLHKLDPGDLEYKIPIKIDSYTNITKERIADYEERANLNTAREDWKEEALDSVEITDHRNITDT